MKVQIPVTSYLSDDQDDDPTTSSVPDGVQNVLSVGGNVASSIALEDHAADRELEEVSDGGGHDRGIDPQHRHVSTHRVNH